MPTLEETKECFNTLFGNELALVIAECLKEVPVLEKLLSSPLEVCTYQRFKAIWCYDNGPSSQTEPNTIHFANDLPGGITWTTGSGTPTGTYLATGSWGASLDMMAAELTGLDPYGNAWVRDTKGVPFYGVVCTETFDLTHAYGDIVVVPDNPKIPPHIQHPWVEVEVECLKLVVTCDPDTLEEVRTWTDAEGNVIAEPTAEELATYTKDCPPPPSLAPTPIPTPAEPFDICDAVAACLADPLTNPITKEMLAEIIQGTDLDDDGSVGRAATVEEVAAGQVVAGTRAVVASKFKKVAVKKEAVKV